MKLFFLMIPSLIVVIACWRAGPYTPGSQPATNMSTVSFAFFDARFGTKSKSTDAQKQAAFPKFKGQTVEWTGIVSNADGQNLFVRENVSTITDDVQIVMRDDEKARLQFLEKGESVTYRGTIDSYGGAVLSHKLIDGEIVSHKRIDQVETMQFLTETETEVVDAVSHQ